jgi:Na+-translocating ferredoxin:NAD+ oxidoreductase subunit G
MSTKTQTAGTNNGREYVYPVVILVVISVVTTALLAITNFISSPIIAANQEASANATRKELLADADSFTLVEGDYLISSDQSAEVSAVYEADNGVGMVITIVSKSFGGDLTMMVGLDAEGAITGVKVTDNSDTPGVGSKDMQPDYLAQYDGLTELTSENVKKETSVTSDGSAFEYITGASVSGSAIHNGVYLALDQFKALGGAQ